MSIAKTVKSGNVEIIVSQYADGRFGFDFSDEKGKRIKRRWTDESKAVRMAREHARTLSAGRVDMLSASRQEWASFEAWQSSGLTIEDLSEFKKWKAARANSRTVAEIRDELLSIKKDDSGIDPHYIAQLSGPWERFAQTFGARNIAEISAAEIEEWLRIGDHSPRTRNNIRDTVVMLFRFARRREYLPDAITAAEKIERIKIRTLAGDIDIYTPGEMRALLKSASADLLPWLVIGGFAGIRTEEMRPKASSRKDPLRWEDFRWADGQIILRAETSKIDRTRYIPIQPNLAEWLKCMKGKSGEVIPMASGTFYGLIGKMRKSRGIIGREKNNALRHSYGSYRNAIIKNINQLAEEMGNSPGIARKNYERPQPRSLADEWFGIMPG